MLYHKVSVGDIVEYIPCFPLQSFTEHIIRRIIKIEGDRITTKGDHNAGADPPIKNGDIVGKIIARRTSKEFNISFLISDDFEVSNFMTRFSNGNIKAGDFFPFNNSYYVSLMPYLIALIFMGFLFIV